MATELITPTVDPRTRPGAPSTPSGESRPSLNAVPRTYWLHLRRGPFWDRGRAFEFPPPLNEGTLGRSFSCNWRVNDSSLSRLHAALVRKPRRGVYLVNLASRTGTFVNGQRVVGEILLMEGDRIQLGPNVELEFGGRRPPVERTAGRLLRKLWLTAAGLAGLAGTLGLILLR